MKKLITILFVCWLQNAVGQTISVTGYNYDVLVDPVLNGTVSSLRTHDFDRAGFSFYADGFSATGTKLSNGLPSTGAFTSPTGTSYQLRPYNQNNALWLGVGEVGTLTLNTPASYNTIRFAATSGSSTVYYTVTYTDGTSDVGSMVISDWGAQSSNYAIHNLGRVGSNGVQDGTIWSIYEGTIIPNSAKSVKAVSFKDAGSWLAIFAISSATGGTYIAPSADKTAYLDAGTNSTSITTKKSGSSYSWKEISTDYGSGATIVSPTSQTTRITGLPQGTFYFEATINGSQKDTVVVRVNQSSAPKFSVLKSDFEMTNKNIVSKINYRGDTTNYLPQSSPYMQFGDSTQNLNSKNWWILYRDRMNGMMIDSARGKIYTIIEDGYGHGSVSNGTQLSYARSEIQMTNLVDTNNTYMYEWKGYFPHPPDSNYFKANKGLILAVFQVHGSVYDYAVMNFELRADGLYFRNEITGATSEKTDTYKKSGTFLLPFEEIYNKSHTLRVTFREGLAYPGQKAFIKVDLDGVTKYYRNKGGVGSAYFDDYAKIGSLYDWNRAIVNPDALSRNRKFSIANESLKNYVLLEHSPLVKAGATQVVNLPTTTVTLTGTAENGSSAISSYLWTKVSGGSATITTPASLSTTVTRLAKGNYVFNLKVTDANGLSSNSNVKVMVDSSRSISVTGYNYDVIVDNVLNGTVSSLRNHDVDGSGYSFYADRFSSNSTSLTNGLPSNGTIISPTNTIFQLQPFNQNNALWLGTSGTGTLTLTVPSRFNKIKIALTSGGSTVNYKINYSDGTNDVISHSIGNWACQSCTGFAINDLGRTNNTGVMDNNVWAIYEDSILPNPNKTVNSITFTSSSSWTAVFALTAVPITVPANIPDALPNALIKVRIPVKAKQL